METILVQDDDVNLKVYSCSDLLTLAGVLTFLLLIFKIFGIGFFATAGWSTLAWPFAICGAVLFFAQVWR